MISELFGHLQLTRRGSKHDKRGTTYRLNKHRETPNNVMPETHQFSETYPYTKRLCSITRQNWSDVISSVCSEKFAARQPYKVSNFRNYCVLYEDTNQGPHILLDEYTDKNIRAIILNYYCGRILQPTLSTRQERYHTQDQQLMIPETTRIASDLCRL